jgi:class 3 adenylate cyclase/pimeloyl-ACP methyl ester carboxylesterase
MADPPIRYVRNADGLNIAYSALGEQRPMIAMPPGLFQGIELEWQVPRMRRMAEVAARSFRYIRFDPHGCGLSDRNDDDVTLDAYVRDLEAVADEAAREPFALFAPGAMSAVAIAYAARHPERLTHLVLWMAFADVKDAETPLTESLLNLALTDWRMASESTIRAYDDWEHDEWGAQMAHVMRESVKPATYVKFERARHEWNVTDLLPHIQTPTLVIHPKNHKYFRPEPARRVAAAIPGARLVLVDTASVLGVDMRVVALMGEFFGVPRQQGGGDTQRTAGTAVILFADIASSTALTERMGDAAFRERSRAIDTAIRDAVRAAGGTPVEGKVMGDGVMSTFASARQAIDAALRCREASAQHELPLHLGIHAGDVIREADNVYGGAVNIAARICDASEPGEILVSEIVRGLARTSAGVMFEERGERAFKGIDEPQRLWAVVPAG